MDGITVIGKGEAHGTPNLLMLTMGVSVQRHQMTEATEEAGRVARDVLAALVAAGVEERDLQTQRLSVGAEWDHQQQPPRLTGYRVDNMLQVRVRRVSAAGGVVDAAVAAGGDAVRIDSLTFAIEDETELRAAAQAAAWTDAAAKASHLAELAGVELGAPVRIDETTAQPPAPMLRAAAFEHTGTPIAPGEHTTTVTLTVTFAIAG